MNWVLEFIRFCCCLGTVYLDHAGATLYSELQMEAVFKDLSASVYGNPRILFCGFVLFTWLLLVCEEQLNVHLF